MEYTNAKPYQNKNLKVSQIGLTLTSKSGFNLRKELGYMPDYNTFYIHRIVEKILTLLFQVYFQKLVVIRNLNKKYSIKVLRNAMAKMLQNSLPLSSLLSLL